MGEITANFFQGLNDCKDGDRYKIAVKNQKRQALIDVLHLWAAYVLSQSAGDRVIALASNFKLRKASSPLPPIKKPENFRIVAGLNPFELAGKLNRVSGANTYLFQYAKDEMMALDTWQSQPGTSTKCTISNLESGVVYNCRVVAIGSKNQAMISDVVRCRVA